MTETIKIKINWKKQYMQGEKYVKGKSKIQWQQNYSYRFRVKRHCSNEILESVESATFREQQQQKNIKSCEN